MSDLPDPNETPPDISSQENVTGQEEADRKLASRRRLLFISGFLGWFLVNGLIWELATQFSLINRYGIALNLFVFPANILALIIFSVLRSTRPIGQGILVALGLNLLVTLYMGLFYLGVCFLPFFLTY